jgi:glycosyltransferase involved in cell wall biosynthesis
MKISVIIPVYNEKKTIIKLLKKVQRLKGINKQIIVIDDGSTDGFSELIKSRFNETNVKLIFHKDNMVKGEAIRSAPKYMHSDIVIVQDADLEYDPNDYYKLLEPFKKPNVKVVYGSRVLKKKKCSIKKSFSVNFRVFGNHVLTIFSNLINQQNLTDAHTCYKLFNSKLFKNLQLTENDFGFCPEVTTKISNLNLSIFEVPISYHGRGYDEGKKIGINDAFRAFLVILTYKFFKKFK